MAALVRKRPCFLRPASSVIAQTNLQPVTKRYLSNVETQQKEAAHNYLLHLMECFPTTRAAFAYGSGVFQQEGNAQKSDNMLDLVFVVDDASRWHADNIKMNRSDYSGLAYLGSGAIAKLQEGYGAHVYYNTLVPKLGRTIKYGVITKTQLLEDLLQWTTLFVSGRLHKPVSWITTSTEVADACEKNLDSALSVALLTLPEKFTVDDLFLRISGISYSGDPRMIVGENPHKVANIVKGNQQGFENLYLPRLERMSYLSDAGGKIDLKIAGNDIHQPFTADHMRQLMDGLPRNLRTQILMEANSMTDEQEDPGLDSVATNLSLRQELVTKGIGRIVRKASSSQTLMAILPAGLWKTCVYSMQKLGKMFGAKKG